MARTDGSGDPRGDVVPAPHEDGGRESPDVAERTVLAGGVLFGVGFGALVDVALFHQLLQWHHLLSAVRAPTALADLRWNVFFDGVFSLGMLGVLALGAALVWRAANRASEPYSTRRVLGSVLVGAGAFNVFDGVVDHYVLHLHDVVHGTRTLNPHWVGASLLLLGIGLLVMNG